MSAKIIVPPAPRATIDQSWEGVRITIPAKRNPVLTAFFSIWLFGWFLGLCAAIWALVFGTIDFLPGEIFLIVWLSGWSVAGMFVARRVMYTFRGSEVLSFSQAQLSVKRLHAWFTPEKIYNLRDAKNFRVIDRTQNSFFGFNRSQANTINLDDAGIIKFDYGASSVSIASDIDECEARAIISLLKEKRLIDGD